MHLKQRKTQAFTLVEMCVAVGISMLLVGALGSFSYFMSRSCASMTNYAVMDKQGQLALDKFTQQVRQVQKLTAYSPTNSTPVTSLTFLDYDGGTLRFTYNSDAQTLTRTKGSVSETLL